MCRSFGDIQALQDLDLVVQQGEVFGLLGHNGAGKTTTIRLLNGVLRPDHGTIEVFGFSPIEQGEALRIRTGVLTETPSVDDRLSGWENLELYARLYGVDDSRRKTGHRAAGCVRTARARPGPGLRVQSRYAPALGPGASPGA